MHPFAKHKAADVAKARVKTILKAGGGGIDNSIDISKGDEGPSSLGAHMAYEQAVKDTEEVTKGTRFSDNGSRIPGRLKAKNDAYMDKLKKRN